MLLSIDLGTTATKAALWHEHGLHALARAPITTQHPRPGWVEQDPEDWWTSVRAALDALDEAVRAPIVARHQGLLAPDAVVLSGARQSLVPVAGSGAPLGPGIVWSDRRATVQAAALSSALGGAEDQRRRTGQVVDAGSVAAKVRWLAAEDPARLAGARWLLAPRDLVVQRLTGRTCTDWTLASATGLYDAGGSLVAELAGPAAGLLPEVVASATVAGPLLAEPAAALGIRPGTPVIVGAGDRACEVLGTAAGVGAPPGLTSMISWGTTANVSIPIPEWPDPVPGGVRISRGALGGYLLEGGVSAAGSLLGWLAALCGTTPETLVGEAADVPPGAQGVTVLPWLGGARAPWWCPEAGAAVVGLTPAHDRRHLARAAIEGVARDVARCLAVMEAASGDVARLALSGGGATMAPWPEILAAMTGLPTERRRSGEAASAGAALVASAALGLGYQLDRMDPVVGEQAPGPAVAHYRAAAPDDDRAAAAILSLAPRTGA